MLVDVRIPTLPESVPNATLLAWRYRAGDEVRRGDVLIELETDKVVLEVPAPAAGKIVEIAMQEGETGESEQLLARIEAGEGAGASPAAAPAAPVSAAPVAAAPSVAPTPAPVAAAPAAVAVAPAASAESTVVPIRGGEAAPGMGPAARHLVAEHNLDPAQIAPSGKDGRVTKADVLEHIEGGAGPQAASAAVEPAPASAPAPAPSPAPAMPAPAAQGERTERREPMSRLRRRIAERLQEAQKNAAILTTFNEVDMHRVMELRRRHADAFERAHGVRLGFMSFFVRASVLALQRYPLVNAFIDGDDIVHHDYCDIGVAVGSPRGLVVPILRNAERLSFAGIEQAIAALGERANDGSLSLDELTGGTFTISNGGVFGSLLSTPILNPPQSAILGMHRIQQRPVVDAQGNIVARPMMYLALSYDHRIIDGRDAVQFLVAIKEGIEDPARLLLGL